MEPGDRNATRAPAPGHGATVMAGHSGPQIHLLLSHGPPPRRIRELVPGAHGRAPAPDARARHGGPPLRRRREADHHRLHRLRRLGMGRGSVRRRPAGLQEADLRDALRRSQRRVRAVRAVLCGGETSRLGDAAEAVAGCHEAACHVGSGPVRSGGDLQVCAGPPGPLFAQRNQPYPSHEQTDVEHRPRWSESRGSAPPIAPHRSESPGRAQLLCGYRSESPRPSFLAFGNPSIPATMHNTGGSSCSITTLTLPVINNHPTSESTTAYVAQPPATSHQPPATASAARPTASAVRPTQRPDEPNPPSPRRDSLSSPSSHSIASYRATTICAMRSPGWISYGSRPRLRRITRISPR